MIFVKHRPCLSDVTQPDGAECHGRGERPSAAALHGRFLHLLFVTHGQGRVAHLHGTARVSRTRGMDAVTGGGPLRRGSCPRAVRRGESQRVAAATAVALHAAARGMLLRAARGVLLRDLG